MYSWTYKQITLLCFNFIVNVLSISGTSWKEHVEPKCYGVCTKGGTKTVKFITLSYKISIIFIIILHLIGGFEFVIEKIHILFDLRDEMLFIGSVYVL